ncbi:cytochrome P450 [Plantactinospora siamensis]|uniref:Cytochrome P450 n=1 Tax=Plantactinospora siamensis TaxID=555372 RepID=A0ABV6NXE9_9ACTN
MGGPMLLNPYAGGYVQDPTPLWREVLAGDSPVRYAEDLQLWLIGGYDAVRRAFADARTFSNALTVVPTYPVCPAALELLRDFDIRPTTIGADAPVHDRTRAALRAAVANNPGRVAERYGRIVDRRVDELVGAVAARAGEVVDLVPALTSELPLRVVLDILGIAEDADRIRAWARGQVEFIWGHPDPADQVESAERLVEFWRYCTDLVARRAATAGSGTDAITRLLAHRGGDDRVLTEAEVAALVFNLIVAGHETTTGLLAHALEFALAEPDRWRRLVAEPAGIPGYVEETLRYGPPIDGWLRVTTAPVTIGEVTIPAGARCLLLIGAANRDGRVFADPDGFDPDRDNNTEHLSFGFGSHFCFGAPLARLEARTLLERLTARLPELRLAPGRDRFYRPNLAIRNLTTLPVVVPA